MIPRVAASESGGAQTRGVATRLGGSRTVDERTGARSGTGWNPGPEGVRAAYAKRATASETAPEYRRTRGIRREAAGPIPQG